MRKIAKMGVLAGVIIEGLMSPLSSCNVYATRTYPYAELAPDGKPLIFLKQFDFDQGMIDINTYHWGLPGPEVELNVYREMCGEMNPDEIDLGVDTDSNSCFKKVYDNRNQAYGYWEDDNRFVYGGYEYYSGWEQDMMDDELPNRLWYYVRFENGEIWNGVADINNCLVNDVRVCTAIDFNVGEDGAYSIYGEQVISEPEEESPAPTHSHGQVTTDIIQKVVDWTRKNQTGAQGVTGENSSDISDTGDVSGGGENSDEEDTNDSVVGEGPNGDSDVLAGVNDDGLTDRNNGVLTDGNGSGGVNVGEGDSDISDMGGNQVAALDTSFGSNAGVVSNPEVEEPDNDEGLVIDSDDGSNVTISPKDEDMELPKLGVTDGSEDDLGTDSMFGKMWWVWGGAGVALGSLVTWFLTSGRKMVNLNRKR